MQSIADSRPPEPPKTPAGGAVRPPSPPANDDTGDMKKAQQMFRALLLQKFEGNVPITKAEVFFHLAEIHDRLGEKPKALQMAERAVQTDASLAVAQSLLERLKA